MVAVFGDLYGILFFKIDVPGIFGTAAVGGEGNFFAIGAPAWVGVVSHTIGQLFGFAARHGDTVNVAHKVKSDALAIGADVERHPGAFRNLEFDFALGL